MVTIKEVVLAKRVEFGWDGEVSSISERVADGQEFVLANVPAMPKFWLVFLYDYAPAAVGGFHVAAEVRTSRDNLSVYKVGEVHVASGSGQFPIEVPVLVEESGSQWVSLLIDYRKVWEQSVSFTVWA